MRYFCVVHNWESDVEALPVVPQRRAERQTHARSFEPHTIVPASAPTALMRAVVANVEGDASDVEDLFAADVSTSGPATAARSREELACELDERRGAFAQHDVVFEHVEVTGDLARVEWIATGLHVGPFVLESSGVVMEPTGLRLRVRAVTVAKFRGNQICSWRSSWDDMTMMERAEPPDAARLGLAKAELHAGRVGDLGDASVRRVLGGIEHRSAEPDSCADDASASSMSK